MRPRKGVPYERWLVAQAGKALEAKVKADEAGKEISGKQAAFDVAVARKKSARIRAKFAAQMVSELKAVIAAGDTAKSGASDDAKAALSAAWGRSFAAADLLPLAPEQLCWSAMQATGQIAAQRTARAAHFGSIF